MDALSATTATPRGAMAAGRDREPGTGSRAGMRVASLVAANLLLGSLLAAPAAATAPRTATTPAAATPAEPPTPPTAARLHQEANGRFDAGDVAVARALLQRAWHAHQAAGTDQGDHALAVLFDLGASHLRLGELADARRCFELAAAGFEARTPPDTMALSLALEGLTATLVAQENTAEARSSLARTRTLRAPLFGPEHPQMVRLDALEARLARLDGRLQDALAAMDRAKEGYRAIHGNLHPTVAAVVRNFIDLHLELDEPLEAELMAQQADYITREVYGARSPERATTLAALGRVNWALGRHPESARFYGQALELLARHGRTSVLEVATGEAGLGRALLAAGDAASARAALRRAAEAYERAWWLAGGRSERATFMASPYPLLAAAALMGRDDGEPDHDTALAAWQALEQHQGRTVRHARQLARLTPTERTRRDSLQQRAMALSHRLDDIAVGGTHAQLADLRRQRAEVDARLQDLDQALRDRLDQRERPGDHGGRSPGAAAAVTAPAPSPTALAHQLPAGTAAVGWLDVAVTPDSLASWAWVATATDGLRWIRLPAGDAVASLAVRYRRAVAGLGPGPGLAGPGPGLAGPGAGLAGPGAGLAGPGAGLAGPSAGLAGPDPELAAMARELFRLRLEPCLPWLRDATALVAVPGSALAGVPLATLVTDDGRTVLERWTLTISTRPSAALAGGAGSAGSAGVAVGTGGPGSAGVAVGAGGPGSTGVAVGAGGAGGAVGAGGTGSDGSAGSAKAAGSGAVVTTRASRLLALADPPFSAGQADAMRRADPAGAPSAVTRSALADLVRGDRRQVHRLARLPGTRGEVTSVARLFPEADLLLGEAAREDALRRRQRSGELARYDVIHLATHALVDADRPERSALVLAQVDLPPGHGADGLLDGLLTAEEITAGWHLDADLVTLSACETGLGRPAPGEGYLGFTQAFLTVGARSVLVSLWQVDDRATALLMERFYANLRQRGLGKAAALQEAQAWLQRYEVGGRRPFAAPRHWGAFVLVGEG